MTHRRQRGWLKQEKRSQGETWVLFFRTVRKSDGKRVENKIPIGLVKDFSRKSCTWAASLGSSYLIAATTVRARFQLARETVCGAKCFRMKGTTASTACIISGKTS